MRKTLSLLVFFVALGTGCGGRSHPVDPVKANETVRTVLESWKAGKAIDEMSKQSPAIVVQDFDWMKGARLLEYQLDEGKPEDANLRIVARLTLRDGDGRTVKKTVTYVVGTSPALTVFRTLD